MVSDNDEEMLGNLDGKKGNVRKRPAVRSSSSVWSRKMGDWEVA